MESLNAGRLKPSESQSLVHEDPHIGMLALLMLLIFAEGYIGRD
jgi:hypothetical protein